MKYKRIILKLSGESLKGKKESGICSELIQQYAKQIIKISQLGCEIGVVIGGGNIFRGLSGTSLGFDRVKGDQMGMLATVINSIALQSELQNQGAEAKVFTSIRMEPIGQLYCRDRVAKKMAKGIITILAGGTGNPFFTTDTAAALRAIELKVDILLKGTRVDGVYDSDPETKPKAIKYDELLFEDAISKGLNIMDLTAFSMCQENSMNIIVFNMNKQDNLFKIIKGEKCGTFIKN